MIYKSKKDAWLVAVIALGTAGSFAIGCWLALAGDESDRAAGWLSIGVGAAVSAFVLWLTCPLYYEVTPLRLLVRSGRLGWDIPLSDIDEVSPSNSPLSSPALSLDRLRVSYRARGANRFVLISPQDKSGFIRELASNDPGLRMNGETLRRID